MMIFLVILILLNSTSSSNAAPNSVVNDLYPTEEELKVNTSIEMEYKKVPPEHYKWDSNLKFAEWDGIFPELKNPGDVTENTIAAAVFRSGVQLVRFGIFLLQMGFSTNILTASIGELDGKISVLSEHFFTKVFPAAATLLLAFMIVAYMRGQKGEMIRIMLVAFIVSVLFIGGIKNISTLSQATSGIIDDLSISVLGITNLDGNMNSESAKSGGLKRLAESNNMIWQVTVDQPWTSGQFASQKAPTVLDDEKSKLRDKGITVSTGETWKDLFLQYAPGSIERTALVDVLADEDIQHASKAASDMMKELAPPVRSGVGIIAFVNSLAFLILAAIVGGLMNVSGILLLGGIVASPIMVPMPFLANVGMDIVKKYLSLMISFGLLKVTATIYLSIIMLLLFFINLVDWHFWIVQGLTLLVLAVGIYLSPKIWKQMTPGLARISGIGERMVHQGYKKVAPQENLENLYERYANRRQDSSTEDLIEKGRMNRIRDTRTELESLQELKQNDSAQFTASGLDQRETELTKTLRKDEISRMDLGSLQNERFKYENKQSQGLKLSDAEQADFRMIQQQERQQIRTHVKPEQRRELDQNWSQQRQFYNQKLDLQQQKAADPLLYARTGGEVRMQYLNDKQQYLQQNEQAILRNNSLYDSKLPKEEQEQRASLREYLKNQQGDSLMSSHLSNLSPEVAIPERQMYIESLSHDELKGEQESYHAQMEQGVQLSEAQKNDYLYMQHNDWMKTIGNLDERDTLQNLHFREMSIESQLKDMDSVRTDNFKEFEASGGEETYKNAQSELYQTRQETQEVLRNSGHSEIANHHVQFAENRDMLRTDSYMQKANKEQTNADENEKIVELHDFRKKQDQQEQVKSQIQQTQDKNKKQVQVEQVKLNQQKQLMINQSMQENNEHKENMDLTKMTVAEYTAMIRNRKKGITEQ